MNIFTTFEYLWETTTKSPQKLSSDIKFREIIEKMELKGESLKEMEPERAKAISKLRSDIRHRKNM